MFGGLGRDAWIEDPQSWERVNPFDLDRAIVTGTLNTQIDPSRSCTRFEQTALRGLWVRLDANGKRRLWSRFDPVRVARSGASEQIACDDRVDPGLWKRDIQLPFVRLIDGGLAQDVSVRMQHGQLQERWESKATGERLDRNGLALSPRDGVAIRLPWLSDSAGDSHRKCQRGLRWRRVRFGSERFAVELKIANQQIGPKATELRRTRWACQPTMEVCIGRCVDLEPPLIRIPIRLEHRTIG